MDRKNKVTWRERMEVLKPGLYMAGAFLGLRILSSALGMIGSARL